ncbi:MAG: hypothetical protein OEU49_04410 [Chromatiales bacterium]|jgi:hypothetical protein|nr:hypothetical protein [Chromatiales bacterium]MDH4030072.1 hypothetical protein [Chromatiales bacterium]
MLNYVATDADDASGNFTDANGNRVNDEPNAIAFRVAMDLTSTLVHLNQRRRSRLRGRLFVCSDGAVRTDIQLQETREIA